jgi:hypothetical protein
MLFVAQTVCLLGATVYATAELITTAGFYVVIA